MRQFNETIFLGAGQYSVSEVERLKKRLEEGISILGGLQQPGHPESEAEAREEKIWYNKAQQDLTDIIEDIKTALGAK